MNKRKDSGSGGFDGDDLRHLNLGAGPKKEWCPPPPQKKPDQPRIPTFGCVMWSSKFSKELEVHKEFNESLHTTLQIGRFLSEAVVDENSNMDWKKPFLLLDVVYNEGHKIRRLRDNSILIPVVEKLTATNTGVPTQKRLWQLNVGQSAMKLGIEMLRRVPTTIMLWGAKQYRFEGISDNLTFQGKIVLDSLDESGSSANVLIFHSEELTRDQKRTMQGNFKASELSLFSDDYRFRIINNMKVPYFAVHLSKLSSTPISKEIQKKLAGLLVELLGDSDDSEGSGNEPGGGPSDVNSNNISKSIKNGTNAEEAVTGTLVNAIDSGPFSPPVPLGVVSASDILTNPQASSNAQEDQEGDSATTNDTLPQASPPIITQSSVTIPLSSPAILQSSNEIKSPSTPPQSPFKVPKSPFPSAHVNVPTTITVLPDVPVDVREPDVNPDDADVKEEELFEESFDEVKGDAVPSEILAPASSTNINVATPSPSASNQNGSNITGQESELSSQAENNSSAEENSVGKFAATQNLSIGSSKSEQEIIQIDSSSEEEADGEVEVVHEHIGSPANVLTPSSLGRKTSATAPQFGVRILKSPIKMPQSSAKPIPSPTQILMSSFKIVSSNFLAAAAANLQRRTGKVVSLSDVNTPGTSATSLSLPSTSQSSNSGPANPEDENGSSVKTDAGNDSVSKFAATQHLNVVNSQTQSEPEVIQLDSSSEDEAEERQKRDKEVEVLSAKIGPKKTATVNSSQGKHIPKARCSARGGMRTPQRKMASQILAAAGSSTQTDPASKFANTQYLSLSPDYSQRQVEAMEVDDNEQQDKNLNTAEKMNPADNTKDPKDEEEDKEDPNAYRFTQALDELTK